MDFLVGNWRKTDPQKTIPVENFRAMEKRTNSQGTKSIPDGP